MWKGERDLLTSVKIEELFSIDYVTQYVTLTCPKQIRSILSGMYNLQTSICILDQDQEYFDY